MEIDTGIAAIAWRSQLCVIFLLETLLPGPRLDVGLSGWEFAAVAFDFALEIQRTTLGRAVPKSCNLPERFFPKRSPGFLSAHLGAPIYLKCTKSIWVQLTSYSQL